MSMDEIEKRRLAKEIETYCQALKKQAKKHNVNLNKIKFMEG